MYANDSDPKDQDTNVGMSSSVNNPTSGGASVAMDVDFVQSRPFAMVDEIAEMGFVLGLGLSLFVDEVATAIGWWSVGVDAAATTIGWWWVGVYAREAPAFTHWLCK
ncbi:hypothetical protein CASFOL_039216 [Castilleja foliolosa]|uniref:Uncharacterized protein n=1 Tax=Castilleja foliolosa TaxID=1961234 RepID=A0ABD3BHV3_9LAMI